MAQGVSIRVSSRRNTPQPTTSTRPSQRPARRITRVTRSQSREISDNEVGKLGSTQSQAKPRRSNATTSGESIIPSKQPKDRAKPSGRERALQDLPEVDETSQIRYPELPQNNNIEEGTVGRDTDPARRQSGQTIKSTGGMSGFSGTTIRSSRSGQELSNATAQDMADALEDLSDASDKILGLLLPEEFSEASVQKIKTRLSDPKSRERRQLARYSPSFQVHRDVFGDARFIAVQGAVRTVLGLPNQEDLRLGPWRMEPILYKANLTAIVRALFVQNDDSAGHFIEELDKDFPRPFLQRFATKSDLQGTADSSALFMDTFVLALEIRTRSFIRSAERLISLANFDPESVLQQVFYKNGNVLNGWDADGMRSGDLTQNPELHNTILNRLDELRQNFSEIEPPYIDLESLNQDFSHGRLIANLSHWSQLRLSEIGSQIGRLEGADGIVRALQNVLTSGGRASVGFGFDGKQVRPNPIVARIDNQPPVYDLNSPEALPSTVARLKQRQAMRRASKNQEQLEQQQLQQQYLQQQSTSAVPPVLTPSLAKITATPAQSMPQSAVPSSAPARVHNSNGSPSRTPSWQPPPIEDEESPILENEPNAILVDNILQTQEMYNAESNKENVAVPPRSQAIPSSQPASQREAPTKKRRFIDAQPGAESLDWESQESGSVPSGNSRQPAVQSTQGQAGGSQIDVSDDEGFQQDTRQITRLKKRTVEPRDESTSTQGGSPSKRARIAPRRREPVEADGIGNGLERHNNVNDPPAPSQIDTYRIVNSAAKLRVAIQPKRPQTRRPWSEMETNRLQELIEEFGLGWSYLKQQDRTHPDGPALGERDQVALKDKARNMKLDYLKASIYLPKNFRGIPINAAHVDKLSGMGIKYDREIGMRTDGHFSDEEE
ncbi:MAG: hypothetical protein Q9166_006049 [cf. Caloplaca sp. 2 TL-2023]